jgi:hypothetical protein
MMEALSSSETSVFTTAARRNISEDDILHSHRRENLKSYIQVIVYEIMNHILLSHSYTTTQPVDTLQWVAPAGPKCQTSEPSSHCYIRIHLYRRSSN